MARWLATSLLVASLLAPHQGLAASVSTQGAAAVAPDLSGPHFLSCAPPEAINGTTLTTTLAFDEVVTGATVLSGTGISFSTFGGHPVSLHVSPPAGSQTVSIRVTDGSGKFGYQNWTLVTVAKPYIVGSPTFLVTVGNAYSYQPTGIGAGGSWSFTGAPYLSLNATTGKVSSASVGSGTYVNVLRYSNASGSYSQAWITTTSGMFPASVNFTTTIHTHTFVGYLSTSSSDCGLGGSVGVTPGAGDAGVFSGSYLEANFTALANNLWFSDYPTANDPTYDASALTGSSPQVTFYYYGSPATVGGKVLNGFNYGNVNFTGQGFAAFQNGVPQFVVSALGATAGSNWIRISWGSPPGTVNATVYRGSACGTWTSNVSTGISSQPGATSSWNTTGLNIYAVYVFGVRVWAYDGEHSAISCVSATTGNIVLTLPTSVQVTGQTSSSITLAWTLPALKVTNVTIFFGTSNGSLKNAMSAGNVTQATVLGLASATLYYLRVEAWNGALASGLSPQVIGSTLAPSGGGGGGGGGPPPGGTCTTFPCPITVLPTGPAAPPTFGISLAVLLLAIGGTFLVYGLYRRLPK